MHLDVRLNGVLCNQQRKMRPGESGASTAVPAAVVGLVSDLVWGVGVCIEVTCCSWFRLAQETLRPDY